MTDMLINELVEDTATELHHQQNDNIVDRQSAFIRDAPSVETLLHRLRVIEVLQCIMFSFAQLPTFPVLLRSKNSDIVPTFSDKSTAETMLLYLQVFRIAIGPRS